MEFAGIIEEFYGKLKEDPEFTCCSCERLLLKKTLTNFKFTAEKFKSFAWIQLKNYLLDKDPHVAIKSLYVCTHCRPILNEDNIPDRCVLNGVYTEPVTSLYNVLSVFKQSLDWVLIQEKHQFTTM